MQDGSDIESSGNYHAFRDCVFAAIVDRSAAPTRYKKSTAKRRKSTAEQQDPSTGTDNLPAGDPSELADFSNYIASEIFPSLPDDLQTISPTAVKASDPTTATYSLPLTLTTLETITALLPPTVADTLTAYGYITPPASDTTTFLNPILSAYITTATAAPPPPSSTRTSECELCLRDWIPLTYHHLIPRSTHARVLKRGWHPESDLQNVAWLCRACHSFVHRTIGNEELAREWYTVELLAERDDVRKWVGWVGGVRWKKR